MPKRKTSEEKLRERYADMAVGISIGEDDRTFQKLAKASKVIRLKGVKLNGDGTFTKEDLDT